MRKNLGKAVAFITAGAMAVMSFSIDAQAATSTKDVLPSTGISYALGTNVKALSELLTESESSSEEPTQVEDTFEELGVETGRFIRNGYQLCRDRIGC